MNKNMEKSEKLVYLTYEQHDDEIVENKNIYSNKVKAYKDGSLTVFRYKESRIKPGKLVGVKSAIDESESIVNSKDWNSFNSEKVSSKSKQKSTEDELIKYKEEHLWRVKRRLRDYARNNDFDTFWTLTYKPQADDIDDDVYRFNEMQKFLRKMRDKYGLFRYIAVPERHKSGNIHWHMVTGDLKAELIDSGIKRNGAIIYNSKDWIHGFTDVQKVRSKAKVANYISKYLTKDLVNSPSRKGKKKYWTSQNLKLPSVKYGDKELIGVELGEAQFETDIVEIFELSAAEVRELNLEILLDD